MSQTTHPAAPIATLEIRDSHLPARMVAGRLRADLPLSPSPILAGVSSRRRLRRAALLLMLAAPLLGVTRRSRSAA